MKDMALLSAAPNKSTATYTGDAQSPKLPPSASRWFLSGPGGPWTAAVVGDGEESESRLLVGVSSLGRLALSPREEKNSMNFQTHTQKEKKTHTTSLIIIWHHLITQIKLNPKLHL